VHLIYSIIELNVINYYHRRRRVIITQQVHNIAELPLDMMSAVTFVYHTSAMVCLHCHCGKERYAAGELVPELQ
jgi:hypothetical protein